MSVQVLAGDMREVLAQLISEGAKVSSIVTDPPYHLTSIVKRFGAEDAAPAQVGKTGAYARASAGFMGQRWDGGDIAFQPETWRLCYELLPPGGHLLAFSGTRTYHRMACAIEDAGFEIRDTIAWLYGSGFPKSHNVAKAIDKAAGAEREIVGRAPAWKVSKKFREMEGRSDRPDSLLNITAPATDDAKQWEGWGTALKPALEPICVARKPLDGTVAANVLAYGTGALNIDGCRIESEERAAWEYFETGSKRGYDGGIKGGAQVGTKTQGRWPANVVLSWPEDEYVLRPDVTADQKAELYRWLSENT